jgi:hypothetical protein
VLLVLFGLVVVLPGVAVVPVLPGVVAEPVVPGVVAVPVPPGVGLMPVLPGTVVSVVPLDGFVVEPVVDEPVVPWSVPVVEPVVPAVPVSWPLPILVEPELLWPIPELFAPGVPIVEVLEPVVPWAVPAVVPVVPVPVDEALPDVPAPADPLEPAPLWPRAETAKIIAPVAKNVATFSLIVIQSSSLVDPERTDRSARREPRTCCHLVSAGTLRRGARSPGRSTNGGRQR